MINRRAKGMRVQRKCIVKLQELGYLVDKVEKTGLYLKSKDLFGLFDLCCLKQDITLYVQVTCNRPHSHKPYLQFSKKFSGDHVLIQQWIWYDRKNWKVFLYTDGYKMMVNYEF